jgi:hypothetical protein
MAPLKARISSIAEKRADNCFLGKHLWRIPLVQKGCLDQLKAKTYVSEGQGIELCSQLSSIYQIAAKRPFVRTRPQGRDSQILNV